MKKDSLGHRIRLRRRGIGLSLRALAAKAHVTASFISQVERGQTNPSIDSLRRMAEALDVSLLYFLSDRRAPPKQRAAGNHSAALKYVPVVRAGHRPKLILPVSGVAYELLTPDLSRKLEAVCGRLAPGTANVARRLREPTEEFIYVLSGSLLVGLDTEAHILHAGDSIGFEGFSLQKLACASPHEEVVWISVITPPAF